MKIFTMIPKTTMEMEQRIRMRYAFAMSSYGRMFTPAGITQEMRSLCKEWSESDEQIPISLNLHQVDYYFAQKWRKRNESKEE